MADVFTELAVKLRGPNPGTEEAQVTSTAGGALQVEEVGFSYDEDTVHTDGDTGAFILGVRNDTLATLADTDGDYAPFQVNADGALYVNVSNTTDVSVSTNYEYAEDSVHTSADIGAFVLAVRNDAGTPLAADGDYIPFSTDASGNLRTSASVTIGAEYAEDSVHTDGDTGSFVLSVRNDTLASLVDTDGDYAPFQVNADGALYVDISGSGDPTVVTNYEYAEDSVHTTADVGAFVMAVRNDAGTAFAADGDYIPFSTDASGNLRVTGGTNSEYAEDSIHTDGDIGNFVLAVRNDTLAALAGTDGDYAPFQVNADGALYVAVDPSTDVDVTTNYEYAEDSVHTTGDIGAFVLGVRNDAGTPLAADGDYIPLSFDSSGNLRTSASVTIGAEYAEDSVHTDGDTGSFVLSVRNDTLASLVDTDGDYAPFQVNADGALYVDISGSGDPTVITNYEYAEDSVHTDADVGAFVLAVRNDTLAALAGTDGDYAPFQVDALGALYVNISNTSDISVVTNSEYAEDSVHTDADVGQFVLAVRNDTLAALAGTDGDYAPFQVNADGALYVAVDPGTNVDVTTNFEYAEDSVHTTGDIGAFVLGVRNDAGTPLAADGDYIPLSFDSSGNLRTSASVTIGAEYAEDSVHTDGDTGSFVLSVRNDTLASLVDTDGDYAPFQVNADGALYVDISGSGDPTVVTNYEYAEDSVHTDADVGAFVLAVRNDTLAALAGTDGDYAPFQVNADGALYVAVDPGTNVDVTTNFEYAEDSVHTTADVGAFVLAVRNDAGTAFAADGDYIPFSTDATGALRVTGGGGGNSEYAEDTVHTDGDTGSYVLNVREDTLTTSTTASGDYQSFKSDSLGRLWTNQRGVFAEDSVHTDADDGQFVLAVRNDTLATLAGTDGDYAPFQVNADGALYTEVSDLSIGLVDDSPFGVGTDEVVGSGFMFDDTATDSVDEGDIGIGRMTADRRQLMRIGGATDANRVNVDDGSMMLVDRIQDTEVEHTYGTVASVANNSTGTITHTVADGDVFYLKQVTAASSGAPMKVVIQYDDGAVTTLTTLFYSDAVPYIDHTYDQPVPITGVSGGTDVEVVITNRAGPAQDVYATIMGRNADLT